MLAYATAHRTREIGLRIAMGASRTDIVRLVVREGLWIAGIGISAEVPLAVILARTVRDQLFGVSGHDLTTLVAVCAVITAVAFGSAMNHARRASKVDAWWL